MGFLTPSQPDPPDYAGAAAATAAGDLASTRATTTANRPDMYLPGATQTWSRGDGSFDQAGYDAALQQYNQNMDIWNSQKTPKGSIPTTPDRATYYGGDPDKWTGRVTLDPEAQKAFDINQRMQTGLAQLGEQAIGQAGDIFNSPFSIGGQTPVYRGPGGSVPQYQGPEGALPSYGDTRQKVYDAMMSRVNTDDARSRDQKSADLIAQGIPAGSEAYQREMEMSDRALTDARQQAEIAAQTMAGQEYASALAGRGMQNQEALNQFNTGMQGRGLQNQEALTGYQTGLDTRRQGIQEALLQRQTPLNEISAFRTGSQVQQPQFQPYGQQQFTGGPNYSGAAQAQSQYDIANANASQAGSNALMGGLFGLGAAGIMKSDRRLKKNIVRVGTTLMGFPLYAFEYLWGGKHIGVMAQDVIKVMPEAVHTTDSGYMMVDYGMIR